MNYVIALAALLLLAVCFQVSWQMDLRTWRRNPGMCVAVIVVGVGCVCAMANLYDWALLIIISGRLIYRVFDRRKPFYANARDPADGDRDGTPLATRRRRRSAAVVDEAGHDRDRRRHLSTGGENSLM